MLMECPQPISPSEENYFEFSNEKNGKKFNWKIKVIEDSLNINITDTTNIINSEYQKTYSKKELDNISKFFTLFNDMNVILLQIEGTLKKGYYEFYENDKSIQISLKTEIITLNKIDLDIPKKENKDMSIIIKLYNYIRDIEEKVKILEKKNQEIKKENQEIKKFINLKNNNYNDYYNDIQFNREQYEKELNTKIDKTLKDFQNVIENKINNIDLEKNQLMKTQINTLIQNSNNQKQILLNKEENIIELLNKKIINNENLQDLLIFGKSEKNVNNSNKNKIEIINEKIEMELSINSCKFIMFDNIKIKNIGKETFKNLYFVKDEKQSSEDIIFIGNDRKNNLNRLSLDGEFKPSDESNHSFNLRINSPKDKITYNLIIYVREEKNGPNISNPLKIVISVKESDEERKKREQEEKEMKKKEEEKKKINDLFEKLNKEFNSKLIKEDVEKIIKIFNFDAIKIKDWIFNKEKLTNFDYKGINKYDVEILYDELETEYNLSTFIDEEEIRNKIIELKCERDALNTWIFERL